MTVPHSFVQVFLTASYDKTVRAWSAGGAGRSARPGLFWSGSGAHKAPILCLDAKGDVACSGDRGGSIGSWDVHNGVQVLNVKGAHKGHVTAMLCPRDTGNGSTGLIMSGGQDGMLRLWDTRIAGAGGSSAVGQVKAHVVDGVGTGAVVAIKSSPCREHCIISAGADRMLRVFDTRTYKCIHELGGHKDFIYSAEVFGSAVVSGGGDGMMLVHNHVSGETLYGLGANEHAVRCIAATSNSLVAAGDDGNALVYYF